MGPMINALFHNILDMVRAVWYENVDIPVPKLREEIHFLKFYLLGAQTPKRDPGQNFVLEYFESWVGQQSLKVLSSWLKTCPSRFKLTLKHTLPPLPLWVPIVKIATLIFFTTKLEMFSKPYRIISNQKTSWDWHFQVPPTFKSTIRVVHSSLSLKRKVLGLLRCELFRGASASDSY